jgi:hypothetical protein
MQDGRMGEGGKFRRQEREKSWEDGRRTQPGKRGNAESTVREAWQSFKGGSQPVKEREASARDGSKLG